MQHLEEGTIHAWLDGALDAEEATRVAQHAAECAQGASAVAEARGLVAGASRILSALDDAPSGVAPRSAAFGEGTRAVQRQRSVWHALRLTPARAAAAAVVILAAGTALVMRQAPNDSAAMHMLVRDSARVFAQPKAPVNASPVPAAASADTLVASAAPARPGRPASRVRETPVVRTAPRAAPMPPPTAVSAQA